MAPLNNINFIVVFLLSQTFTDVAGQQCQDEYSILGMMLRGHIFKSLKTSISFECLNACNNDDRCHSWNYVIDQDICELNKRTKEARPEDFVYSVNRYYVRRQKKTGEFTVYEKKKTYKTLL